MNASTAVSTTTAAPQGLSPIQEIPLGKIRESQTNPRRRFDEARVAELADNIKQYGVLQPILVRPAASAASDRYELVAGERRYRASKLAGRDTLPATVRELTDAQCLEIQLIENGQREDVHPLDEAEGYARLIELQPETYTVEAIATKMGRSPEYINGRLRLTQLIPEAKQACLLLVPSDAEPLLSLLEQLAAASHSPIPLPSWLSSAPHVPESTSNRWLEHAEAAKCLGVSKSTLYRYASQNRIEYRKIAGRLEYRQSVLEKLKQEQVRPARFPLVGGGIIRSALSSGK